jgi:hypothetical protein
MGHSNLLSIYMGQSVELAVSSSSGHCRATEGEGDGGVMAEETPADRLGRISNHRQHEGQQDGQARPVSQSRTRRGH